VLPNCNKRQHAGRKPQPQPQHVPNQRLNHTHKAMHLQYNEHHYQGQSVSKQASISASITTKLPWNMHKKYNTHPGHNNYPEARPRPPQACFVSSWITGSRYTEKARERPKPSPKQQQQAHHHNSKHQQRHLHEQKPTRERKETSSSLQAASQASPLRYQSCTASSPTNSPSAATG